MPISKLLFKPGINRETTSYGNEGGWYDCDKVRFIEGLPQKIKGWTQYVAEQFVGTCRALFNWSTISGENYVAVGTHLKYYLITPTGTYYDITPIRSTVTLTNPFATTNGSAVVTVTDVDHGALSGDYVTFSGSAAVGGIPAAELNAEHSITYINADTYTITVATSATSTVAAGGGASVTAAYQINVGLDTYVAGSGFGAGVWSRGTWGSGTSISAGAQLRLWSQSNFGEDLLFNPRTGGVYYWDASSGVTTRAVNITGLASASNPPEVANGVLVSDTERIVLVFGTNPVGSSDQDPMLIRWSDTESLIQWTPAATNASGDYRLGRGSQIMCAKPAKQETLVWTDSALYAMQFIGAPYIYGFTLVADNISVMGPNTVIVANNVAYWMGVDKFYTYSGRVEDLPCTLRSYVFDNINRDQAWQTHCGLVEGQTEIWWFYCTADSTTVDRYVVYNYAERVWYHGSLARTAWLDSPLQASPIAADYNNRLLYHETGVDDVSSGSAAAIDAYIESSDFDIQDGDTYAYISRILPDVTFETSTAASPYVYMKISPRTFSGANYTSESNQTVTRTSTVTVEQYTNQCHVRVRGRQAKLRVESDAAGVHWWLGAVRIDVKSDGRRA